VLFQVNDLYSALRRRLDRALGVNPLMGTLKPQSNEPLYSNTVIGTLALMGGLLRVVQRGAAWAGWGPAQSPHRCTKCNSPPINGQCTNFILFDVAITGAR